uniref:H15 domain-containing protein n=1 Tax=Meloidogyne incognita TaxID=6306 RepID=A0A914KVG8_MELIC
MSTAAANSPTTTPTQQNAKKGISKKAQKPKSPKASKKPKSPSDHPPYKSMIKKALDELKEKKGASRLAILKFIMSHYKLGENPAKINAHLKQALKRGVQTGSLKQTKGIGAAGSFILGEGKAIKIVSKSVSPKKAKAKTAGVKKPAVKKATPKKKVSGKKAAPAKASPAAAKPAAAPTPAVVAPSPPAAKKTVKPKAKSAKKGKSPKKSVAKKSPIKKAIFGILLINIS